MISENLSHYHILRKLGAGGMGEVYLAEDTRLGRRVALKILPPLVQDDAERTSRFLREARAASALRSPNAAAIYDIGEHEGTRFIAMEYVEGELLSRRIERGRVPVIEAIDVARQVADALDEAHSMGIVHRDIKSSNLIISERGLVKVLDFGIAKMTDSSDEAAGRTITLDPMTAPGAVLGTIAYMSPEQARGMIVDGRSDIFSLGIVLYEMLAGRRPFEGETSPDVLVAILEKDPPPLSRYLPQSPARLEAIVAKALRKDRSMRYQTAGEMAADLKGLKQELEHEYRSGYTTRADSSSGAAAVRPEHTLTRLMNDSGTDASGSGSQRLPARRRRARKTIDSIAVLPLSNPAADAQTEYLSDGITESIINSLSRLPKLRVMARSTVFRYKGQETDAQRVGEELGVRAVMTGRVVQMGDRLVIGTELVDVSDGSQLWGEQYNRELSDIFALQDEIAKDIFENLRLKVASRAKKQPERRPTASVQAYELYLKGRYHWNLWTEDGFYKAIEFYEKALEKDADFALAHAGLSDAYGALWYCNFMTGEQALPKAKEAALRALELDDTLAEANLSLADTYFFYEWDWEKAGQLFRRAIELNPGFALGHQFYAIYLIAQERLDEGIAEMRKARDLDPLSLLVNSGLGLAYFFGRRYEEAIAQFRKTLELDQDFMLAHEGLGSAYAQIGMADKAFEEFLKMIPQWSGSLEMIPAFKEAYAESGMEGFWRKWLEFSSELSKRAYLSPYYMALVYGRLGERDRAFECLDRAYEERNGMLVHIRVDPRLESLRDDPRYDDLLRRMGLHSSTAT
ncbi:MAG TPA: protein kinase [Blastocatellia bacterium]|nr:protein kinase [Blastocatellia bacterium]